MSPIRACSFEFLGNQSPKGMKRSLIAAEQLPLRWGKLYGVLRRLEFTGEVRRGLFVEGLAE